MGVQAPLLIQWPLIVGVGAHLLTLVALIGSTFFWKNIYREGSRMGFAWLMALVNAAFCVLFSLRWMDAETYLRDDGVTTFPPREICHVFTILVSMIAVTLYLRFHCLSVAPSITFEAAVGAVFLLWGSMRSWKDVPSSNALSLYLWILGSLCIGLAVLQLLAWLIVPDQVHAKGDKTRRRQDFWAMMAVGIACVYLLGYAMLELLGTSYTQSMNSDTAFYEWLHLAICTLPIGIVMSVAGILTYWNDVKLAVPASPSPVPEPFKDQ